MRRQRWKNLIKLAWPLIIANSFWNLQMTIDRVFLGQLSTDALGAAMAVFGVFWAPMALVQQTAAYITTFTAQLLGAKREQEIGASVWQSIYVGIIGGVLFLLFIPIAPKLMQLMGHPNSLKPLETAYFRSMCFTALPTALVATTGGFFTGLGKSSIILWINFIGMILNVILDYIMIFGNLGCPPMGIVGAGYATALATWGSALFGLYLVFKKENQKQFATRSSWKFNGALMKRFLKYGLPSGLQWSLEGLAFTIFLVIVGRMANGEANLAASGIAVTVMMLAILPVFGVAQAVSALVGQHLGENKSHDAEKVSWTGLQMAWIYICLIGASFWIFPEFYLSWFHNPENPKLWNQVQIIAPYLLMFVGTFIFFDSMNLVFALTLKGAGDTRFVSTIALIIPWPIMVLPTFLLKDSTGAIYWAWGAASCYIITQALIFWRRFSGGKWKQMRVIS